MVDDASEWRSLRLLVCGDRDWEHRNFLYDTLDTINFRTPGGISVIIEGEAKGADRMARDWALFHRIEVARYPAFWNIYKQGAGPIRNQQMIDEGKPDRAAAFHNDIANSKGTGDMIRRLKAHSIPYTIYTT